MTEVTRRQVLAAAGLLAAGLLVTLPAAHAAPGAATTRPTAHSEGVEHLSAEHHATIATAP